MKELVKVELLGKEFQLYEKDGEKYFSASEVGELVGYSKSNVSKLVSQVEDDEKTKVCVSVKSIPKNGNPTSKDGNSNNGAKQYRWFLTKDGLYELLFLGKNEKCKEFKKQIKEILKNIEKNGFYISTEKDEKWFGVRKESKQVRNSETDSIKEFVEYAKQQGSGKPEMYYKHFTTLVYKKIGIPSGLKRDNMTQDNLFDIMMYERLISKKLIKLIDDDMHYKDVYQKIKDLISEI